MATPVEPPGGIWAEGKHYFWQSLFELDTQYVPIKPIGRGAYGIICIRLLSHLSHFQKILPIFPVQDYCSMYGKDMFWLIGEITGINLV
ncbi:hypothetical protein CTI12_AA296200 [Artemisia annua]|uniref:Uncharacterized protein n=1 Tax=Artemisia annua TaxID=35608 RepID=A0A2U1N7P7_ARTAN|nr:hypothetical protein CTI12_AA296200 [Artemisia annua]